VTTVADTGDTGAVVQAMAELGGSGIAYHEVFGPDPAQLEESFTGLRARMAELAPLAGGRIHLGVSPHAPYTVSGPLYQRVASWARQEALPIAVHIAESREEMAFVTAGGGPFAAAWGRRGIPPLDDPAHAAQAGSPGDRRSPLAWLDARGVLGHRTLCIHAVHADADDIALLGRRQAAVAHCPLSNARHRHGAAPLATMRSAGLRVGLGTDSVASVGRLDLLAEARAAAALAGLDARAALALCTIEGARALHLDGEIGSLEVGKWGDVAAIPLSAGGSPEAAVLASSPGSVKITLLGGRVVHRAPA
jgi:5-methylthioadenosine/S-adenosylhomocysteine deaminase